MPQKFISCSKMFLLVCVGCHLHRTIFYSLIFQLWNGNQWFSWTFSTFPIKSFVDSDGWLWHSSLWMFIHPSQNRHLSYISITHNIQPVNITNLEMNFSCRYTFYHSKLDYCSFVTVDGITDCCILYIQMRLKWQIKTIKMDLSYCC